MVDEEEVAGEIELEDVEVVAVAGEGGNLPEFNAIYSLFMKEQPTFLD